MRRTLVLLCVVSWMYLNTHAYPASDDGIIFPYEDDYKLNFQKRFSDIAPNGLDYDWIRLESRPDGRNKLMNINRRSGLFGRRAGQRLSGSRNIIPFYSFGNSINYAEGRPYKSYKGGWYRRFNPYRTDRIQSMYGD